MTQTSTGEAVLFWVLAPICVLAAIGLVTAKKAVHAALMLAVVMICLAMFFAVQSAPFLAVVQVVVYTGAIMMLFLFVLMLVGVDSSDSLIETLKGQRIAAILAGLAFGILLIAGIGNASFEGFTGMTEANGAGNVEGVAELLFTKYVFAFELTGGLLITAAIGAMVLTHRERIGERRTQRDLSIDRFKTGGIVTPLPSPGVYARSNAVDTPALLPDGTPSELSLSRVLRARGDVRTIDESRHGRRSSEDLPEVDDEAAVRESSQLGKGPTP